MAGDTRLKGTCSSTNSATASPLDSPSVKTGLATCTAAALELLRSRRSEEGQLRKHFSFAAILALGHQPGSDLKGRNGSGADYRLRVGSGHCLAFAACVTSRNETPLGIVLIGRRRMCRRVVSLPLGKPQRSVPQGNRWSWHASLSGPNTIGPWNSCASERRASRARSVLSGLIFRWPWFATDPHQNSCFRYLHRPARLPPGLPMGGGGQSERGRSTPLQVLLAAALRPHRTYCGASRRGCRHATLRVRNGSVADCRLKVGS